MHFPATCPCGVLVLPPCYLRPACKLDASPFQLVAAKKYVLGHDVAIVIVGYECLPFEPSTTIPLWAIYIPKYYGGS